MNTQRLLRLTAICLSLTCGGACSAAAGRPSTPVVSIAGDGNAATVRMEAGDTIIDIRSDSGIGAARIELPPGARPESIVIRLRLTGLEEFRLAYGQTTITASVSSQPERAIRQSLSGERAIGPDSPFWIEARTEDGYFDLRLPKHAADENIASFSIQWIDFFR